jgi:RNA polymerase sigma-54 factor
MQQSAGSAGAAVNPRLYQAMDMLYMPMLDLQQHLKQELLNNPFLELEEEEEEETEQEEETAAEADATGEAEQPSRRRALRHRRRVAVGGDPPQRLRGRRHARGARRSRALRAGDGRHARPRRPPARPGAAARPLGARGAARRRVHRQHQRGRLALRVARRDPHRHQRDDRARGRGGRRRARSCRCSPCPKPSACCARSRRSTRRHRGAHLHECLLLQLKDSGLEGTLSATLVREHFQELIAHRWVEIGKKLGIPPG